MCHPLRRKRQGPNGSRMLGQAHNTTAMFLSQFGNVSVWCSGRHWTWPMVQGHAGGGGGGGVQTPYPRCPQPSFHHPVPSPSTSLPNLDCQLHSLFGLDATVVTGRVPPNLSFTFWFRTRVPRFFSLRQLGPVPPRCGIITWEGEGSTSALHRTMLPLYPRPALCDCRLRFHEEQLQAVVLRQNMTGRPGVAFGGPKPTMYFTTFLAGLCW